MPVNMLTRARHRIGRRGAFLAWLALIDLAVAWSLWTAPPSQAAAYSMYLPPRTWAVIWAAAGLTALTGVPARRDRVQFAAAAAFAAGWAALTGGGWILRHIPEGWVQSLIWAGFAVIILLTASWPEPPPPPRIPPVPDVTLPPGAGTGP
jgi:hypothetical protein